MSIRAGVIIAVAFQEIDNALHAEARAKRNHQSFQNVNSRLKKSHNVPPKI